MTDYQESEVLVTGGIVRRWDKGIVGEVAIDFIRQFRVDFAIVGTSEIEIDGTLRDCDTREVRVTEAIIEHAHTVFLVADPSKFECPALVRQGHLNQINKLFTDAPVPVEMKEAIATAGVQIFVAE